MSKDLGDKAECEVGEESPGLGDKDNDCKYVLKNLCFHFHIFTSLDVQAYSILTSDH